MDVSICLKCDSWLYAVSDLLQIIEHSLSPPCSFFLIPSLISKLICFQLVFSHFAFLSWSIATSELEPEKVASCPIEHIMKSKDILHIIQLIQDHFGYRLSKLGNIEIPVPDCGNAFSNFPSLALEVVVLPI